MKSVVIAFACIALAAADVSHLNLNREYLPPDGQHHHHHHGAGAGAASSASSVSSSQYGGQGQTVLAGRTSADVQEHYQQEQSQDIPDSYAPLSNDISFDLRVAQEQEQDIPAAIGADSYTPAHLVEQEERRPGDSSDSYAPAQEQQRYPGDSSDSYAPAQEQQHYPGDSSESYAPAQGEQGYPGDSSESYAPAQEQQRRPGDSSDSYAPAQGQQRYPGDSSSSYTPAHLLVQEEGHNDEPAAVVEEQYAPAQEATAYQSSQLRFGGQAEQAASGIDTQYGVNGGYVY